MSSDSSSVPTEFVADAFETTVTDDEADRFIQTIDDAVSNLRVQIDDDTLKSILRADAIHHRKTREPATPSAPN
jgi:hypothetical protein